MYKNIKISFNNSKHVEKIPLVGPGIKWKDTIARNSAKN
jgi:hypothetical protein